MKRILISSSNDYKTEHCMHNINTDDKKVKYIPKKPFTEEEMQFIVKNYDKLSIREISRRLGRGRLSIRRLLQELGISKEVTFGDFTTRCLNCGKSLNKPGKRKFCSWECFHEYRKRSYPEKLRQKLHNIMTSENTRERIASKLRGERNPMKRPEVREKHRQSAKTISEKLKKKFKEDPEYRKKVLEAAYKGWLAMAKRVYEKVRIRVPNRSEERLMEIIEAVCPGEYKYNRWEYVIAGKIPDFVNVNGKKKVIELFGDAFHDKEEEEKLIEHYKKHGWDCLVIWASELINVKEVMEKIKMFNAR